jgi:tRNA(Ile2) C34 agmatinyltransferase TiaS
MIYIGIDDTDNAESRGTGRLARMVAEDLMVNFTLLGVTRHQLLVDPRIPYTSHNSSAAICLQNRARIELGTLFERVKAMMMSDFIKGSDPGLCIAKTPISRQISDFGRRAKDELMTQEEARRLAGEHNILLEGLGGSQDGVIGALSAVGLAAEGEDGRYLLVGNARDLTGLQTVDAVLSTGIVAIRTEDGLPVRSGLILADKLRPARRGAQPILVVEWAENHWLPIKLD